MTLICAIDRNWQHIECARMAVLTPSRYDRTRALLQAAFSPDRLDIIDESAKHAGHAGRIGLAGGETHFQVMMVSTAFQGMSRLQRSRAVHEALDAEFKSGLHALTLTLRTPDEAKP
jgi:BolA protein